MNIPFAKPCLALVAIACCSYAVARGEERTGKPKVAAIVTTYYHNSHADMLASRLVQGYHLNGAGEFPTISLASVYTDQVPDNDISRRLAKEHGFRLSPTVKDALTLGTDRLAVDGVLLIAEHGNYPESNTGSIIYPKRRLFTEVLKVFGENKRAVPVFMDKHLSDRWDDARWIYETAKQERIPLMAGSVLPTLWRYPPADVRSDEVLKEIVGVSHHRLDTYGFHALETIQCLAERRKGGETGVRAVRCVEGPEVWEAGKRGEFSRELLDAALSRLKDRPLPAGKSIEQLVPQPQMFQVEYRDGLKATILTLNYVVVEWAAAWRTEAGKTESTVFWTQEARPFMHFSFQLQGIERMVTSGQPSWPVERTLLTTGTLDALLSSRRDQHRRLETPQLEIRYAPPAEWRQPPPPPPGRPIPGQ